MKAHEVYLHQEGMCFNSVPTSQIRGPQPELHGRKVVPGQQPPGEDQGYRRLIPPISARPGPDYRL